MCTAPDPRSHWPASAESARFADAVLVDDYCYYISWLGTGHLLGGQKFMQSTTTPGDHILMVSAVRVRAVCMHPGAVSQLL